MYHIFLSPKKNFVQQVIRFKFLNVKATQCNYYDKISKQITHPIAANANGAIDNFSIHNE